MIAAAVAPRLASQRKEIGKRQMRDAEEVEEKRARGRGK